MNLFQLIFVPLCAGVALWMLLRTFRRQVPRKQGLSWAAVWVGGAVLVSRPALTWLVAQGLGIGRGTDLLLYFAVLAGVAACGYVYNRCRQLEVTVTELARRQAIAGAQRRDRSEA